MTDHVEAALPGPQLTDHAEALFRQIHPNWISFGRITSQAFKPFPKDNGLWSVTRGSKVSAEAAYRTHVLHHKSSCVCSVTVGECAEVNLVSYDDPVEGNPAHASVDFRELSKREVDAKAKHLQNCAEARGIVYQPPEPPVAIE